MNFGSWTMAPLPVDAGVFKISPNGNGRVEFKAKQLIKVGGQIRRHGRSQGRCGLAHSQEYGFARRVKPALAI